MNRLFRLVVLSLGVLLLIGLACRPAAQPAPTPQPTPPAAPQVAPTPTPQVGLPEATATPVAVIPAPATPTPTPTALVKRGGVARQAIGYDLNFWDPARNQGIPHAQILSKVFSYFVRQDQQTWVDLHPDLVKQWKVSDDGLTWTFTVREGVMFHNAKTLTSRDLLANIQRWMSPPKGVIMQRARCVQEWVESAEAPSPGQLVVRLKTPTPAFLACLATPYLGIITEEAAAAAAGGADLTREMFVGTGPYVLEERRTDTLIRVRRNEKYYRPGLPYLDGVELYPVGDLSTQKAMLRAGRVDMTSIFPPLTFDDTKDLERTMGDRVVIHRSYPPIFYYMVFNHGVAPWGDARVRRAIHLWLDRQAMGEAVVGPHWRISAPYHESWTYIYTYDQWLEKPGFNPRTKAADREKAIQLLREAMGRQTIRDTMFCRPIDIYCETGQVVVQQLKELGIEIKLEVVEPRAGLNKLYACEYNLFGGQRTAVDFSDPDAYNLSFWAPPTTACRVYWSNEEFLRLNKMQQRVLDPTERGKILRRMADILLEEVPYVPLVYGPTYQAVSRSVRGYTMPLVPQPQTRFDEVWLER